LVAAFGPDDGEITGVQSDPAVDEVAVVGDECEVSFSGVNLSQAREFYQVLDKSARLQVAHPEQLIVPVLV